MSKTESLKITAIQTRLKEELKESLDSLSLMFSSMPLETQLVVLPESWHILGIIKKVNELIENYDNIIEFLSEKAKEVNAYIIGGALYKTEDQEKYIVAPIISPKGKLLGEQYKINLFEIEKEYFNTKPEFKMLKIGNAIVATMICYDANFPEIARLLVKNGADIIVNPARIVSGGEDMWHIYLAARVLENRVPIIGLNTYYPGQYNGHSIALIPEKTHLGIVKPRIIEEFERGEKTKLIEINYSTSRGLRNKRKTEIRKLEEVLKTSFQIDLIQ